MEYQKENDNKFQTERKIADEIMTKIIELQLPFKLDQPTEGLGNCFPIAIVQQLQRPEIFKQLRPTVKRLVKHASSHTLLRQSVYAFIMKSRHPRVAEFRQQYEELEQQISGKSWHEYWTSMVADRTWVDSWFVQATAWYLQLDIWIITTSNTDSSPYIEVNGNLADGNQPSGGPIITIGTKSNVHYQSILPIEAFHLGFRDDLTVEATNPEKRDPAVKNKLLEKDVAEETLEEQCAQHVKGKDSKEDTIHYDSEVVIEEEEEENAKELKEDPMDIDADGNNYGPFLYDSYGELLVFRRMSDNFIMKCALCGKESENIIKHLNLSQNCKLPGSMKTLIREFQSYKQQMIEKGRKMKTSYGDDDAIKGKEEKTAKDLKAETMDTGEDSNSHDPFMYESNGMILAFLRMSDDFIMKCPLCGMETKHIIRHLKLSKKCNLSGSMETFSKQFQSYKQIKNIAQQYRDKYTKRKREEDYDKVKEQQRKRKVESRKRKRAEDCAEVKKKQRDHQEAYIEKKRLEDNARVKEQIRKRQEAWIEKKRLENNDKVKEQQRKRQVESMSKKRANDNVSVKQGQNRRSRLCRAKKKTENSEKLKEDECRKLQKYRKVESKSDRLRTFREATKYCAVFICTCCQQRMFHSNVQLFSAELRNEINAKKRGHIEACVQKEIKTHLNDETKIYICKTCIRHMRSMKLPPMSAMNGLQLHETDRMIEDQGLKLTELEGALIAKTIIFQKIYQLPKSRWTALKDRFINIPINDDDITNTLEQMPRTPKDAGLIGVALKRKKEYKNSHKQQLVDPQKLFRILDKLKRKRNKYYQFFDDYSTYESRCKETDPTGYNVIFEENGNDVNDELEIDLEKIDGKADDHQHEVQDEIGKEILDSDDDDIENAQEEDDIEYETKDVVKKYQFEYNKSLCMSSKYPEVQANENHDINVAPGEGKTPKDILGEDDWDIKAFPHLYNPDGSGGKDYERNTRLTDQYFFIQRICNLEQRFARSPAYMYAAIGYLEKKQLQRNINMVNTRGKEVVDEMGGKAYVLEDGYTVLDDIKGTPRYWKKTKYEMIAKLDNLGPFHLFFTLSCADMRWDENFASILQEKGFQIRYNIIKDDEDNWDVLVEAKKRGDEQYKPVKRFIEEDVQESLHELIRGNVLSATRYFQHRVTQFINKVAMGRNNPMNVRNYTYKVEFQDRGAGHVHGTLWLRLDKIEKLIKKPDGTVGERTEGDNDDQAVFTGLGKAFKKFRHDGKLNEKEESAVRHFIDEYTTVSTHEKTVGREVARIAQEVNKHHHTKTCRKHDTTCRFKYPRYPAPETIIVKPCKGKTQKEIDEKLAKYRAILSKVGDVLEDEDQIKNIMGEYDKQGESRKEYNENTIKRIQKLCEVADVEYDEYVKALGASKYGYSIVQRRDLDELFINSYNIEWIRAWNGNMDIQIVLDYFAVITYVTDYYSKDESGTMELIKAVLDQLDAKDIKEKMKTVANAFMTHRQMGEAEAVYKLLPSMTLKKSNVACQWVSLGSKEERSSRWKRANEKEQESGRPLTKLLGHDGLWFEQQDMWSKYLRRPMNSLRDMCFAQFAKMYKSYSKTKSEEDKDNDSKQGDEVDEDDGYSSDNADDRFNYIITHNDERGVKIPECIVLENPYPGEPRMMAKRKVPAVLRYNKSNKDNNPKKFMLGELMLYRPTNKEIEVDQIENLYNDMNGDKRKVDIVKSKVMEHLEGVEEARYYVEQAKKELDLSEISNELDAALEQENADCVAEGLVEHPDFVHADPGEIINNERKNEASIYRKIEIPNDNELKEATRSLDVFQREVINIGIKYARGIVKSRKEGNSPPRAPLLMVHGGAGAGKSTVIRILAQWTQKILQQEGHAIDCPCVTKTAFTGTAASNIEGQTLHASFGFPFDNKYYSLSDKSRDQKRAALKNLKMVIIDEISMVKSDMLYQLDLRLQEITEKVGVPFGGLAIFAFGDMMQLQPVMGRYICDKPINIDFQMTYRLESRWHMFESLTLEINHRQGEDKPYADLLNRVRVGKHTPEDMDLLRTRVRNDKDPDMKTVDLLIECKRKECAQLNLKHLNSLDGKIIKIKAKHHHHTQKNYKPWIEKKEGAVATTSFLDELHVKLGAKIMLIHNIDTPDSLTNGQFGILVDTVKTKSGDIDKLVIKLKNKEAGKQNRQKYPGLAARYKDCVFIERVTNQYALRKKSGDVGSSALVIQFPVKLASAITAHKIQGQTIPKPSKVVLDLNSVFEDAQAHVMLSRVQCLDQVYIRKSLDESKIRTSQIGLTELDRLKRISYNENPTPWNEPTRYNKVNIASLNCAGLASHFIDIAADEKLKKADVIHLVETSVEKNASEQYNQPGYESHFINVGKGRGIMTYFKPGTFVHEKDFEATNMQMTKFTSNELDIVNVYRSSDGNSLELLNRITEMLRTGKPTLITGDFNICMLNHGKNRMSKGLMENSFSQMVRNATHIRGGHIDHVYWKDEDQVWKTPILEMYCPYYSDHDASLITLIKED